MRDFGAASCVGRVNSKMKGRQGNLKEESGNPRREGLGHPEGGAGPGNLGREESGTQRREARKPRWKGSGSPKVGGRRLLGA